MSNTSLQIFNLEVFSYFGTQFLGICQGSKTLCKQNDLKLGEEYRNINKKALVESNNISAETSRLRKMSNACTNDNCMGKN